MANPYKSVENLLESHKITDVKTIRGNYLMREIKEGFDHFSLGDTSIEIKMMPRTGVGRYTNFSKRCEVLAAPEEGKYKVGASVWVPHLIKDTLFDGGRIHSDLRGVEVMYCNEQNILFECDNLLDLKSDEWIITKVKPEEKREVNGITVIDDFDDLEAYCLAGAMSDNELITWWEQQPRVELWQKEVQYWAVHIDNVSSVNGEPYGDFYKVDTFGGFRFERKGITLKGMIAKMAELKIERMKGCVIARLENPRLEYHEAICLVRKPKRKSLIHQSQVYATLSNA